MNSQQASRHWPPADMVGAIDDFGCHQAKQSTLAAYEIIGRKRAVIVVLPMGHFASQYAFRDFLAAYSRKGRRPSNRKVEGFLQAVRASCGSKMSTLKSGKRPWRAQVGSRFSPVNIYGVADEHPLPTERMIPRPQFIKRGGRANPPGRAYLYLADSEATALAEMRPWGGESLTLAIFELTRDVRLVVCQSAAIDPLERAQNRSPSRKMLNRYVWSDIGWGFARPVSREDQAKAYIPTQALAKVFHSEGADGIAYQSGLEQGINVVLFDPMIAKPVCCFAYTLDRVRYDFSAVPNHGICREKAGVIEYQNKIPTMGNKA